MIDLILSFGFVLKKDKQIKVALYPKWCSDLYHWFPYKMISQGSDFNRLDFTDIHVPFNEYTCI